MGERDIDELFTYSCIHWCFLYVPSQGVGHATLVNRDDALTN